MIRISSTQFKKKYTGQESLILMIMPVLGLVLIILKKDESLTTIGILLFLIGTLLMFILPNAYSTDKLSITDDGLSILNENNTFRWNEILKIEVFYTMYLVSNDIKVVIILKNAKEVSFFLCKKNIREWENKNRKDFKSKIPDNINLVMTRWMR